jgi:hypothetical protein
MDAVSGDKAVRKTQRNQGRESVVARRKWQASVSDCDIDPSMLLEGAKESAIRRDVAIRQAREATQLAEDYALLRHGTRREEIILERLREVNRVATAWTKLASDLRRRKGRF